MLDDYITWASIECAGTTMANVPEKEALRQAAAMLAAHDCKGVTSCDTCCLNKCGSSAWFPICPPLDFPLTWEYLRGKLSGLTPEELVQLLL